MLANTHASQKGIFAMQQGNIRQVALEVFGIVFAVLWMVQHGIEVREDISVCDIKAIRVSFQLLLLLRELDRRSSFSLDALVVLWPSPLA